MKEYFHCSNKATGILVLQNQAQMLGPHFANAKRSPCRNRLKILIQQTTIKALWNGICE
jgi:hypothetical protein